MIHHKDFPFDPRDEEAEIVHLPPGAKHHSNSLTRLVVSIVLLLMVILSVKALYDFGRGGVEDSGFKIVEANPEPYKIRPENPGGMKIFHEDKEIYEHLKMPIEQPIDAFSQREKTFAEILRDEPKMFVPPQPSSRPNPAATVPPPASTAKTPGRPEPKVITIGADGKPHVSTTPSARVSEPSLTGIKKIEIDKVLAKRSNPEVWMQLGTFKSEQEATKAWQDVREKNSDVLSGIGIKVTKSDMGAQGVVYRLQSGPVQTEEDAKGLCRKLNERGLSCFFTTITPAN